MPRLLPVIAFVFLYMAAAMVFAAINRNFEFIAYGAVMIVLSAALLFIDRRVRFPALILWGLALWGLCHLAGGMMPIPESVTEPGKSQVLYNLRVHPDLPKYDQVIHAYGFFIATIAAWHALRAATPALYPGTGVLVALTCVGMGLGAFNEVVEFAATRLLPGTNVGGYENTGWDLVSNMAGAIAGAVVVRVSVRP